MMRTRGEVLSVARARLAAVDGLLTWGFRQIFDELDRVTDELRKKPNDRALLARSVALYHVVVEGHALPDENKRNAIRTMVAALIERARKEEVR